MDSPHNSPNLSRRRFAWLAGSSVFATQAGLAQSNQLTAHQVIERIKKESNIPWRSETVDTFKAGDPETPVTGIATTVMSTLDVLQRAAKAGKNLIITHEPTFYNHQDSTEGFEADPVYTFKQDFIKKNNIVIWRFHDHWHARPPESVNSAVAEDLGWESHFNAEQRLYVLPGTTLEALAKHIHTRMKIRAMRVVGDPKTQVSKVAIGAGFNNLQGLMRRLQQTDVLLIGESREWEGVEYAHDAVAAGGKKGLIILRHTISEDPGMRACAEWLRTFISEVPVEFVPAGEPFWAPQRG